jgi:hypothetical protein
VLLFKVKVLEMGISKFNYKDPNSFSHRAKVNYGKVNFKLEDLEIGKYFALNENKTMLSSDGYLSIRDFCKDLDPNKYENLIKAGNYRFEYISRYINLNKLISTLIGDLYIVANPLTLENQSRYGKPVPVYLKNIETNELTFFNSISSLCEYLKIKPFRYKLYLDTNRIWKDKYKLISQNELSQNTETEYF